MIIEKGNYLTVEEYRKLCGFATTGAVLSAIHTNRLPAIKIGNIYLINSTAEYKTNRLGNYAGKKEKVKNRKAEIAKMIEDAGYTREQIFSAKGTAMKVSKFEEGKKYIFSFQQAINSCSHKATLMWLCKNAQTLDGKPAMPISDTVADCQGVSVNAWWCVEKGGD